ncbi:MAG: biopolymer transporter ExbD [Gemmatimonadetes bacterium]|nr:biopolymer transporter ExbD [Gemmatimonadota bacterium]NIO32469.1 biopolymer transporter ExbD [Gemmatimonadota bacterium]
MAFEVGNGKKPSNMSDINMTPMIDVLLVLLAIFMIAQPMLRRTIDVQIPRKEPSEATAEAPPIVLEIDADGSYTINKLPIPHEELEASLREIYLGRADRVLFIKADGEVIYEEVIAALDAARGAGVSVLGAVLGS